MLFRLIANLWRLLFWPLRALRRARGVPAGSFVHVVIDGGVADIVPEPRFWESWRPRKASLVDVAKLLDDVLKDDRVRGLLVSLRSFRGGMATATSLRAQLARVRAAGRELVVHLPLGGDTKDVYLASAANRVLVGPQAVLAPLGFASSTRYVKRTLERAGVEPEVFAQGKFKSAGETLVRDSMSEGQREQVTALLDAFHGEVVGALASGRGLSREEAAAAIDGAPYLADDAIAARLVDGVAYEDEVPGLLAAGGARPKIVEADRYLRLVHATRWKPVLPRDVVGVVTVHGPIATQGGPFQAGATDERVIAAVRHARKDPRVKAVVLHVDSPGGSALASDRMHHEIEQLAAEKPLVACFADVAASGGYYVAAAAHAIVAQPTTITGSIGVVAARVVVGPLLARLGVVTEVIKRGAHADAMQPTRHFTDEERARFEHELEGMYRAFKRIVARGRKRGEDEIERVAQGRVWSGVDAAREGLVDVLGGFDAACARARELAAARGVAGAGEMEPVVLRGARHPPPPLDPPQKAAAMMALGATAIARELGVEALLALAALGARERVLAWSEDAAQLTPSSLFIDASSAGVKGY